MSTLPRRTDSSMRVAPGLMVGMVLLIGASLVVPVPFKGRTGNALLDLGHAPAFGLLAIMAMGASRSRWRGSAWALAAIVWSGLVAVGGMAEAIQASTGRHPSLHDAAANALGAAAGLVWATRPPVASRGAVVARIVAIAGLVVPPSWPALVVIADAALQPGEMPVLASFESRRELTRWIFQDCREARSTGHATDGALSLRLDLGPGVYPGATLDWPVRDWSGYRTLRFDAYLAPGAPLDLAVKIEEHNRVGGAGDRFERLVRLEPGPNRITIALADIARAPGGRPLDLRRIGKFQLFVDGLDRVATIYLDDVRLE